MLRSCIIFVYEYRFSKDAIHFYPLRKNRWVMFGFSGETVLVGWGGQEVSFNTTVGGGDGINKLNSGSDGVS